jgi:acetylornithine deacetylase/succinyl-diaminopimelate desuccinylase-like protein
MADALAAFGLDPAGLGAAPRRLERLRGFLEIHIDQTAELHQAGVAAGPVRNLAARLRLAVEIHGAADHAGTTRREERRDALAAAAHMMVAAEALAEPRPGFVVTTARLLVEPNALTTVPSRVRMWIDARAPEPDTVVAWERDLRAAIGEIAASRRVQAQATRASFSEGTAFDGDLLARLAGAAERLAEPVAEVTCFAGHDAGVIAARRPAGMLLVRNAAGVSHAPQEHVELEDAAVAARIVLETLEELP